MENIGISLGWNCATSMFAVDHGIRKRKGDGYNTCPFDIMVSNYRGVVDCLNDNFSDFCNENFLELRVINKQPIIYNTKYNFIFNHEGLGYEDLYITEKWEEGIDHFIVDNYRNFKKRYSKRIENFKNYLSQPNNFITFVMMTWDKTEEDIADLKLALQKHYPQLNYYVLLLNHPRGKDYIIEHLLLMNHTYDDYEIKRLL